MRGIDAEYIALARTAQRGLHVANPIHAVGRDPAKRHAGRHGAMDHLNGERRLGGEARALRHMRRRQPRRIVRPGLGQIQGTINEGMAVTRDIGREHTHLAVGDLARRTRVLPVHAARSLALLQKSGLINHQNRIIIGQGLDQIGRAVLLAQQTVISVIDLSLPNQTNPLFYPEKRLNSVPISLDSAEKSMLLHALEMTRNNVSEAARMLGITRMTMRYRMDKHQIKS